MVKLTPADPDYKELAKKFKYEGNPARVLWGGYYWIRLQDGEHEVFLRTEQGTNFDTKYTETTGL